MRVVIACDWLVKYAAGQAEGLARSGADVVLLCRDHALEFGGDDIERARVLDRAREQGVRVLELPGRLWQASGAAALVPLARELRRFAPDVTHVHDHADPRFFAILPRALRVLTIHDPDPHPGQEVLGRALSRAVLRYPHQRWRSWAQLVVVHSSELATRLTLRRGQQVSVIPHGLEVRDEPLPVPSDPVVGFFGRREPYKGLDVLARAMPRVWSRRTEVRLRVAGAGTAELPLADHRVEELSGYLPEAEVERFLASLSVIALPYTEASASGVGSVAIGAGVPVVASRLGALPDLVLDESYLVRPGDDGELAEVLLAHLDDDLGVRRRVLSEVAYPKSWQALGRVALEEYERALRSTA